MIPSYNINISYQHMTVPYADVTILYHVGMSYDAPLGVFI